MKCIYRPFANEFHHNFCHFRWRIWISIDTLDLDRYLNFVSLFVFYKLGKQTYGGVFVPNSDIQKVFLQQIS